MWTSAQRFASLPEITICSEVMVLSLFAVGNYGEPVASILNRVADIASSYIGSKVGSSLSKRAKASINRIGRGILPIGSVGIIRELSSAPCQKKYLGATARRASPPWKQSRNRCTRGGWKRMRTLPLNRRCSRRRFHMVGEERLDGSNYARTP